MVFQSDFFKNELLFIFEKNHQTIVHRRHQFRYMAKLVRNFALLDEIVCGTQWLPKIGQFYRSKTGTIFCESLCTVANFRREAEIGRTDFRYRANLSVVHNGFDPDPPTAGQGKMTPLLCVGYF